MNEELYNIARLARELDEKALERYSSDKAVQMIAFVRRRKKLSLAEFTEKARKARILKSLDEVRRECFIAFGCAVLSKLNLISKATVWDFLFTGDENCPCVLQDPKANRIVVDSYYDNNTSIEGLEGVVAGLYAWWHDSSINNAVYCALEHGYSFEAAYAAKIMAC